MGQFIRNLGVAVLAAALLNASAGLCFCHSGPGLPGASPSSGGCCHGPGSSGATVVKASSPCCHIESADSTATPVVATHLAPPAAAAAFAVEPAAAETRAAAARVLAGASPPLFVLRI